MVDILLKMVSFQQLMVFVDWNWLKIKLILSFLENILEYTSMMEIVGIYFIFQLSLLLMTQWTISQH